MILSFSELKGFMLLFVGMCMHRCVYKMANKYTKICSISNQIIHQMMQLFLPRLLQNAVVRISDTCLLLDTVTCEWSSSKFTLTLNFSCRRKRPAFLLAFVFSFCRRSSDIGDLGLLSITHTFLSVYCAKFCITLLLSLASL